LKIALILGLAVAVFATSAIAADAPVGGAGPAAEALKSCNSDLKYLNSVSGWQTSWPLQLRTLDDLAPDKQDEFFGTWMQAPSVLQNEIAALRRDIGSRAAAPKSTVKKVLQQLSSFEEELTTGAFANGAWASDPKRRALVERLRPAVENYRAFLEKSYLPYASNSDGLPQTPEGKRCFETAVEWWTGINLPPDQIEKTGWELLDQTDRQLLRTAGRPLSQKHELLEELRRGPKAEVTAQQIIQISKAAINRAEAHLNGWFVDIPNKPLDVVPIPASIAASAPAGSYQPASDPSGKPVYRVNTSRPHDRRLMAEVIAFHEGVPGHHLAAIATQNSEGFNSGFGEGWGIYAEYLADEMHLYSTKYDRMGMMAKHLWAASRLIVEPGLHIHGWSREKAIDFMLENTTLPKKEIEIEVDRYISWPGQSLSYMLGYERFRAMRERAQKALRAKFSLPQFHRVILSGGMRSLDDVDRDVTKWIAAQKKQDG
jgi:uncharacterized protein (DUF885 family)